MTRERHPDDADTASAARAAIGARIAEKLRRNPMVSTIANDRMEIFVRHGFLTPAECAAMMAQIDAGSIPSKLFSGREKNGFRSSSSCNHDPDDPLIQKLTARLGALTGYAAELGETIQGQRYAEGQEYKGHCDYFPGNVSYWPDMRDAGGQRCWTAMMYLNPVEEGGETHFVRAGFMVPPRAGTLLVWNNMRADGSPNSDTLHAALPVRRGVKYVLTKWYRERPWSPVRIR
ncbi:2OG-Fe(II) oxygenase [Sphingobium sufflavum]|uniref:prolyl hydroxylase family protein n=1 Tax=Sphingobium sufflavum TaxID=1129547 RepID=UPI001F18FF7A|nr:2OG-Fe(II) oxygenase [Sphingobium sufflavum]MCE7798806.1 2OG-Fe(II) oxygenase [Sphingobium sufflavum]